MNMSKIKDHCIEEQQAQLHDQFVAMEGEGEWYVNRYQDVPNKGICRTTFADQLNEKEAKELTKILNKFAERIW